MSFSWYMCMENRSNAYSFRMKGANKSTSWVEYPLNIYMYILIVSSSEVQYFSAVAVFLYVGFASPFVGWVSIHYRKARVQGQSSESWRQLSIKVQRLGFVHFLSSFSNECGYNIKICVNITAQYHINCCQPTIFLNISSNNALTDNLPQAQI
jgi:hypothetical protein